ncbi:MAG TPA: TVP38/TMEM64 family protein [Crinalium sp.]|jgi:uncharacterized membrane protein YdjX (TVP38/TMEM64 family)
MKVGWLRRKRFWLLVLVAGLLVVLGRVLPVEAWLTDVKHWLISLGPWAAPAFILIYLLATILGLPNIILILIAGTLFGLVKGIISVSIADTLGAIACFFIGRTIARKRVKRWMSKHPKFANLDQAVNEKGWKILLLTRLSPLVPSNILNYGFSCTKVDFWQYTFFSWLGMLPIIALYVYAGAFGRFLIQGELTPAKFALQAIGLIVTVAAAFYTTRFTQKALTPSCKSQPSEQ